MVVCKAGFLVVEVLISLAIITGFVVLIMRYQAYTLSLQTQGIKMMEIIDLANEYIDEFPDTKTASKIPNCTIYFNHSIDSATMPKLRGNPPNMTFISVKQMKVLTVAISWKDQWGEHQCLLPHIYKGKLYE